MLVFLGLSGYYSEEELEDAIAKQLEVLIIDARQRATTDYYITNYCS